MGLLNLVAEGIETDELSDYPKHHPLRYRLPDLLGPKFRKQKGELWSTCYFRRAMAVKEFIEGSLRATKGSHSVPIKLCWEQLEFITDGFYGRDVKGNKINKQILWKNRGGGGSLSAAIVIFMKMIWFGWSFLDMAGSGEQAKQVYEYVSFFWYCIEGLEDIVDGEPRQTSTKLLTGATLKCIPASEKQARSKHVPGFVADESCQKDPNVGDYVNMALQGVFSEPEYLVILLSTFHVATGFFQEKWDTAETQGYKTYYWNTFHTMQPCKRGLKHATARDPKALRYCREKCPLTDRKPIYDEDGEFVRWEYQWCNGLARDAEGFQRWKNIFEAKKESEGSDTFHVEHAGNRPVSSGPVYHPDHVMQSFVKALPKLFKASQRIVGIDWGWAGETSIVGPCSFDGVNISIPRTTFLSGTGLDDIMSILSQLKSRYGSFGIFCDSSHPFNIDHFQTNGWDVEPVVFSKWKEYGIGNVARWMATGKVKIAKDDPGNAKLRQQLLRYFRDESGKPKKKHDHGPDGLLCALLNWNFLDYNVIEVDDEEGDEGEKVEKESGHKFLW